MKQVVAEGDVTREKVPSSFFNNLLFTAFHLSNWIFGLAWNPAAAALRILSQFYYFLARLLINFFTFVL